MSVQTSQTKKILRTLFPHVPPEQIQNQEYRYMSTEEDATNTINIMTKYCREHGENDPKELTIADAFACLGNNTCSFCETFKNVVAYEKDETRFHFLQTNVRTYPGQKPHPNVFVYKDCLAENGILYIPRDIIFWDPPWENPRTKAVDSHVFHTVIDLCKKISQKGTTNYVFLKLPLQSKHTHDFESLRTEMSVYWTDIEILSISRLKGGVQVPSYTIVCAYYKDTANMNDTAQYNGTFNTRVKALLARLHNSIHAF
jgi:hypothetical protein